MLNQANIQRAILLMEQNRYTDAKKELQKALAQDPEEAMIYALLGECAIQEDEGEAAVDLATQALRLEAAHPYYHSVLAKGYMVSKNYAAANQAITEAIQLDPYDSNYVFLKGNIAYLQKKWQEAFELSERALNINAENVNAINLRSMALVKLNRKAEASQTADYALHKQPENPYAHANKGWAELERNNVKQAQGHFREALRFDPLNNSAQIGLKEAIKAENFLYRQILQYFLWISKLSEKYQWGFIIGIYILYRILMNAANNYPALAPLLYPIIGLYVFFALSTWIAVPIANAFLRLHRLGKYALTDEEKLASNLVVGLLLAGIVFFAVFLITNAELYMLLGGWCGFMALPTGVLFNPEKGTKGRMILTAFTAIIGIAGLLGIFVHAGFIMLFFGGIFFYSFAANAVAMGRWG